MIVTIVPILFGAFGTITKRLLKAWWTWKLADGWRLCKWQHYWERPEYLEVSWRLEEICCHSNSNEKPSANTDVKSSKGVNNNTSGTNGFISFCLQPFVTRGERQFIKPKTWCISWCLKYQLISAGWDPDRSDMVQFEKSSCSLQQSNLNSFLQIP